MPTLEVESQFPRSLEGDLGLLPTKLARPRVPPRYVARPQVDRLLDKGALGVLTTLSAGPGWGKTLAAAHWAASKPADDPVAWVSLDDDDNEPRRFWSYFMAALRGARGVAPSDPLAQLVPGFGDEDEFLRRLLVGLTQLDSRVMVVLDDFHLIREPAVLSGVGELLRHRVDQLRLVLLTRSDPTLPLHRLRVNEDLTEVRARDLAFDVVEASALLEGHGVPVSTHEARMLVERTEGWPAGLRLAALFLARQQPQRRVADFAGDDQTVTSYLAEEVLGSQPPEMRRFLLRTSITERLSGELAEVLTGQARSQQHLEDLELSNAFVVGLGSGRHWFRYHALMREMLQHRLAVEEPGAVPELHTRAARWFAENGYPIEALRHAADADDWNLLGRLFVTQAFPLVVSVDRVALDQVLARVPTARLTDGPELALCAAARHFHAGRFQAMQPHLDLAAARLDESGADGRSGTRLTHLLLSTAVARARGDMPSLIEHASQALDLVSASGSGLPAAPAARAITTAALGVGLLWAGQVDAGQACLREALPASERARIEVAQVNVLSYLALIAAETGDFGSAIAYATRGIDTVESRGWGPLPQSATAYLALSMVKLQQDNIAQAQTLLAQGRAASAPEPAPRFALDLAQVRLDATLGRVAAARARLLRLRNEAADWQPPTFLSRWWTITEAEVDLAADDPSAAAHRMASTTDHEPPWTRERLILARARLAGGDAQGAEEVLADLRHEGQEEAVQEHEQVDVWLLTALAADSLRADNRATDAMRHAVQAAGRDRIRRPFVTLDPERIPRLLVRLKEVDPGLTDEVDDLITHLSVTPGGGPSAALADPLTDRELMILSLLPTMMTNAEIAAALFVSVNTVKAHLKHIYRKLDVDTRRLAAQRARELGLLAGSAGPNRD